MSDCKHHNKIWYGVEGWDCEDCPESGELYQVKKTVCRSGCKSQDHVTYAECLEAANIGIDKASLRP